MIKHLLLSLTCVALLGTLAACGPRKPGNYNPRAYFEADFKKADTDQDESLTREETALGMPSMSLRFDEVDLDKNDRLNFAEVWSYVQWRQVADTPGDAGKPRGSGPERAPQP